MNRAYLFLLGLPFLCFNPFVIEAFADQQSDGQKSNGQKSNGHSANAVAIDSVAHLDDTPKITQQWDVLDVQFKLESLPKSPVDLEFSATFRHESGRTMNAAGFYDGENTYVLRFTPPLVGRWTYRTSSTRDELDGLNGDLTVHSARPGRNGGILLDPQRPRCFQYENGDAYFPIAIECDWLFALDAENPRGIPRTRKWVDTLAANGFNQVVLNVYAFDVNWPKDDRLKPEHEYGSPAVFPFGGSNSNPDHSILNISFFKRFDRVIHYLDQKGIAAHLMIYVWNKQVNWPMADSEHDNRYFDYVVRRYQAFPNLIWDVSKEALGYGHNDVNYITKRIQRLRKLDHFDRLVTVHAYGYCKRFPDQVDFVSVQTWLSELHGVMRKICGEMPGKPILNIEHGGYERGPYVVFTGNYTSPEVCLERAWKCVFAGTYPTHYWQGAAWNAIVPDVSELAPNDRPRLEYYRHMRSFVDRYKVDRLRAGEQHSNGGFCLNNGKDLFIYMVPKECDFIGVRPPKNFEFKTLVGTWFNPYDGSYSEPVKQPRTQWPAFTVPEGEGFRILIVELSTN